MPKQILVASPHLAFGELLRLSLEESGQYRVRLAQTSAEARGSAGRAIFSLLILDADLKDCTFAELTFNLTKRGSRSFLFVLIHTRTLLMLVEVLRKPRLFHNAPLQATLKPPVEWGDFFATFRRELLAKNHYP